MKETEGQNDACGRHGESLSLKGLSVQLPSPVSTFGVSSAIWLKVRAFPGQPTLGDREARSKGPAILAQHGTILMGNSHNRAPCLGGRTCDEPE